MEALNRNKSGKKKVCKFSNHAAGNIYTDDITYIRDRPVFNSYSYWYFRKNATNALMYKNNNNNSADKTH